MMRSLRFKLIGAFALVILVGAAITYAAAIISASTQFEVYVGRRAQMQAPRWVSFFADYYLRNGGWDGVESLVISLPAPETTHGASGQGRGGGQGYGGGGRGQGFGPGFGRGMGGPLGALDERVLLADLTGRIVYDSTGAQIGQALDPADLPLGLPVISEQQRIGTLVILTSQTNASGSPAADFLSALNQGIWVAALIAGLIAIGLGILLVRHITAPLRRLQAAAHAIATGDLSQRVETTSRDELGDVARAFNQMAENLERDETLRRHMMADIAHELRTPLTVMQGQVEALLDGVFPLTSEQLMPIHDQTVLMSRLVTDLRDLALAEAGKLKLERQPTDLGDLTRRVAAAVEPVAAEKGISLAVEARPDLPSVVADADRLQQVLHNLLSNALRHTPAGGRIAIAVDRAATPKARPTDAAALQVTVSDTGSGIAAEDLPYVFDRFYRADRARPQKDGSSHPPGENNGLSQGGGSGLGLTIARTIVEAHGGRIWANSRPGKGTQITFTVPAASQNAESGL
jgi:signal transduction histidine kinase